MDFVAGMEMTGSAVVEHIPRIVMAILVFYVGRFVSNLMRRIVVTALGRIKSDNKSLANFAGSCVQYAILFFTLLTAISIVGIDTAGLGGVILGLSAAMAFILQGSLADMASGVMLMIFRPFKTGDDIEVDGVRGHVTHIEIASTHLKSSDNVETIIQNSKLWGGTVRNYSGFETRRLDMVFGVDYNADINTAMAAILEAGKQHDLVRATPAPWAKVVNLGGSSVDIELRVWCKSGHYRALKASLSQPVKAALDRRKINIPYPTEIKIKKPKTA